MVYWRILNCGILPRAILHDFHQNIEKRGDRDLCLKLNGLCIYCGKICIGTKLALFIA